MAINGKKFGAYIKKGVGVVESKAKEIHTRKKEMKAEILKIRRAAELKYAKKLAEAKVKQKYKESMKGLRKPSDRYGVRIPFTTMEAGIKIPKKKDLL